MALVQILGNTIVDDIRELAIEESTNFIKQTPATKLALVNDIKIENIMMKHGIGHLIEVIDEMGAENELLEKRVEHLVKTHGQEDADFKDNLVVYRTPEKEHAKIALIKHIQNYENNRKNRQANNKVKPTQEVRISKK
jgi:hypothetical protein